MSEAADPQSVPDTGSQSLSMAGGGNPWLVAIVVSIATFMEVLDISIANVSLRYIAGDLAAGPDESTWVLTSYLVSNAIVLPISGWLANAVGRKRFYMSCVALFTISSLLCGFAPSLTWLIIFRVMQGIGGGGLAPSEQSILADTFRPDQRGMAFALYGIAVVFAPAIGPTVGGWISDNYSWRWVFLLNVPVGIFSLALSYFVLHTPPAEEQRRKKLLAKGFRIDYIGFALVAVGLGCLQVVLDKGERDDWFSSNFILTFAIASGVALIALVPWELLRPDPIVELRLFFNRGFAACCAVMFGFGFIMLGTTQLLPQLTQDLFGYTATLAGLVITPGGFAVMICMPFIGLLLKFIQPRTVVAIGLIIEVLALFHLSGATLQVDYSYFMWARIFQAVGVAFLFVPITTAAYVGLPANKTNEASALINVMRNLGGSVGISMCQTALAEFSQRHQLRLIEHLTPYDRAYREALPRIAEQIHATPASPKPFAVLMAEVQRQAAMLSYIEIFYILAGLTAVMLPLIFLIKTVKPGEAPAGH
ncbi:MAG TPA: DHA2 family efflux MFS transporter permease subunit [Lacipirellulaceae bacterium]|jgi:DHA2 family multidrug resistance protein|nr:DHA2 family efflux MFS transporter permease subunit [Lacipirellulaceae bacterium]